MDVLGDREHYRADGRGSEIGKEAFYLMAYGKTEQIDRHEPATSYRRWLKRAKNRAERRRNKKQVDCVPMYKVHYGYST